MQPTLYASFPNPENAERAVGALLEGGVDAGDISLVVPTDTPAGAGRAWVMADSGEADVPLVGNRRVEVEGSTKYESQIGAGISTSQPSDAAAMIQEMDDSEEAAEDTAYPASGHSIGWEQNLDVEHAADTGFFDTTKPETEELDATPAYPQDRLPNVTSMDVPGVGVVLGDGGLATELVGAGMATAAGGNPAAGLAEYLRDQGVPADFAMELADAYRNGNAVLAVATPPGTPQPEALQPLVEQYGAENVRLIG